MDALSSLFKAFTLLISLIGDLIRHNPIMSTIGLAAIAYLLCWWLFYSESAEEQLYPGRHKRC